MLTGRIVGALLFSVACAAAAPPGIGFDQASAPCMPDRAGARDDVDWLLSDDEANEFRTEVGLSGVDPSQLEVVTQNGICANLRDDFKSGYKVQGANAPFIPVYYRIDNRYIVHIVERLDPTSPADGATALLVYDLDMVRLQIFLI